jgi:thioesterase domain-containing protein/acyl carrier protein
MESLGASVHLASVDISNESQLTSFLDTFRHEGWPPIRGVVHAAGVLHDQLLTQLDGAALNDVSRAKLIGSWLLHNVLIDEPLDFFVLFSSAASLLGSAGQANYATVNAFLDGLAHYRRTRNQPGTSINWGPWAEVGMAAQGAPRGHVVRHGIGSIYPEQGLELLNMVLRQDVAQVAALPFDWTEFFHAYPEYRRMPLLTHLVQQEVDVEPPARDEKRAVRVHGTLLSVEAEERRHLLESLIREQVGRATGIDPSKLDLHQPLQSLGMDSLMGIELKNRLEGDLGVVVPVVRLLEGPSIGDLVALVHEQLTAAAPSILAGSHEDGITEQAASLNRSQVVSIQPFGARLPFFCVHPGALDVECYSILAGYLGDQQPFYVLQPQELDNYHSFDGPAAPTASMAEIAARCIEAMRDIQPDSPYLLGGWSLGGVLAFEIARQLTAQGHSVSFLALFDSPTPGSRSNGQSRYDDSDLIPVFARYLGARRGKELLIPNSNLSDLDLTQRFIWLLQQARTEGILPQGVNLESIKSLFQAYKAGLRKSTEQLRGFEPQMYSGKIGYFRASSTPEEFKYIFPHDLSDWRAFTAAPIEVIAIPGDHYTMLIEPHVRTLAEQLTRLLQVAQSIHATY